MKRLHLVILLVVLLVLVLFTLRLNDRPPPQESTKPGSGTVVAPTAPDAPPSGNLGREDHGVGTTSLPRAPAPLERP